MLAKFPIVGVGASAGGLEAFTQLLEHLPADSGMAFVLIQHLEPTHASLLGETLAKVTRMPVEQALGGMPVEPNHVYVIPPDADISLLNGALVLTPRTPEGPRPHLPIDVFMSSLASECGNRAIGVVLSGTASDGTEGLRAIYAENGITFVQDPASARFKEMPRSALEAGVVDYTLAIPELAKELVRVGRHPYVTAEGSRSPVGNAAEVAEILAIVREIHGVDFTEYKAGTVERRLARRLALRRVDRLQDYLALLRREPDEVRALGEDILIHVTAFFRDREAFEALQSSLLPAILAHKGPEAPVRIWVAGCSTGEEIYSIGICLLELLDNSSRPVQLFGSDLSEASIAKARAAIYPEGALLEVSEERRRRYFLKTERGYRVKKVLRDLCVFVQHDLTQDPPFSKLDLVSCRNVLIYFDQVIQKRVVHTFHYALNQPGYLLLGRSESLSAYGRLFSVVDGANKIFARAAVPSLLRFAPRAEARPMDRRVENRDEPVSPQRTDDVARQLDRLLLARYSPPGVLIDARMEILQFRGQTGPFLQPAPGQPQNDLIKMARPGLLSALRETIARAQQEMAPVRRAGVEVDQDGVLRTCDLVVFPFAGLPAIKEPLFVVLFESAVAAEVPAAAGAAEQPREAERLDGWRIPRVEHELMATKAYLQSLIEEHGRTNEDLGSANQELVSGNEELQSMNEELETAKEELQSTNEELTTVNDELQGRNQEVTRINTDLLNLLVTVDIPIVILDLERRIRRFTPKAKRIFNLLPTDHGRQLDDIRTNLDMADLERQIANVIDTVATKELEVQDREGRWYRMQIRPYTGADKKVDGAIVSLVDIDALKHHVSDALEARSEAERANHAKDLFLAVLGHELRTPLTSLLLQSQLLGRGVVKDAARIRRVGELIERATRMQMQLVDDLLDVSRIVAGKLKVELRSVDLPAIVRAAIDATDGIVQKKAIRLEAVLDQTMGMVRGDAARLQQVVLNLLTNAIKFTPKHGQVTVTLDVVGDRARLEVRDTGAGIEREFLSQVFNRFSQEDGSNTRMHGGLGLGLAIVRHLVEEHGGTVQADSAGLGKGAAFSVFLPFMKAAEAQDEALEANEQPGLVAMVDHLQMKDVRVLVVDDDLATREAISEILSELGADVRVAESAGAAMTAISEWSPAVLVCDIAMPGEDGYTFLRRLRRLDASRGGDTPALALTALMTEDHHRQSFEAGFQMHLTKPIDIDRLSRAVVELAGRQPVALTAPQ